MIKPAHKLLLVFFLLGSMLSRAAIESVNARLENPGAGGVLTVIDNKYGAILTNVFDKSYTATVLFGLTEEAKKYYTQSKILFEITFDAYMYTSSSSITYSGQKLSIIYDRNTGTTYVDRATWVSQGYNKMIVKVTGITATDLSGSSPVVLSSVPKGIYLEGQIDAERYYGMDAIVLDNSFILNYSYISATNEFEIHWNYLDGAEKYDLEWVFVSADGTAPYASYSYDLRNNATRVTTTNNWYRIPNMYGTGLITFRVRPKGYVAPGLDMLLDGPWTNSPESGTFAGLPANVWFFTNGVAGANNLNWSATATFDENGRQGTGINYADGLLKDRQGVVLLNSEGQAMTQSTYYDYNGRPVINILPTPVNDGTLKYYVNQYHTNPGSGLVAFDKDQYDADGSGSDCNVPSGGIEFASELPSAAYYSPYTASVESQQADLPQAEKYPFVQVEYTPDLSGRIKSSTLPGLAHKIGSGKETKYFYANPGTQELDRLFGSEVGYTDHYEKKAVIDANGQTSVSYVDMAGRTIATALSGSKPLQLDAISSYAGAAVSLTDNLLTGNHQNPNDYTIESTKTIFVESAGSVQQITYNLDNDTYTDACAPLCFDCIYELEMSIRDECQNELLDLIPGGPIDNTIIVGNVNELDGSCTEDVVYLFSLPSSPLSVTFPKAGTYVITKKLKVSDIPVSTYANLFIQNNTCLPSLSNMINDAVSQLDFSSCGYTCAQCSTALNTYNAAHPLPEDVYNQLLAECNQNCDDDPCDAYKQAMMADLTPGGQYALYNDMGSYYTVTDHVSLFYAVGNWQTTSITYKNPDGSTYVFHDASGNPASVMSITLKDFIDQFQDQWAEYFLSLHPEYCYLQFCNATSASLRYDDLMRNTDNYDDACKLGLIIPIASSDFSGCVSVPYLFPSTSCAVGTYASNYDPFFAASPSGSDPTKAIVANSTVKCFMMTEMQNFNKTPELCSGFAVNTFPDLTGNFLSTGNTPSGYSDPGCGTGAGPSPAQSIYQFAATVANCNGSSTCSAYGSFGTSCNKDLEWEMFRNLYLMKKQVAYDKTRATYAIEAGCYNGEMASGGTAFTTSQLGAEFQTCTFNGILDIFDPNPVPSPALIHTHFGSPSGCTFMSSDYKGIGDGSQVNSCSANASIFNPKTPRFFDISMMGVTAGGNFGTALTGSGPGSGSNAFPSNLHQQGVDFCTNNANNWMNKLSGCINPANSLPITDLSNTTLYNTIKAGLIDVCSRGVDANNPFGASYSVPAGTGIPGSLQSFQAVLENYLGTTESRKSTCNAYLINSPDGYNHSVTSGSSNTQTLDHCACDKIFQNEAQYTVLSALYLALTGEPPPNSVVDVFNIQNAGNGDAITTSFYNKLKCSCEGALDYPLTGTLPTSLPHTWSSTELSNLGSSGIIIPGDMGCPNCVCCTDVLAAQNSFTTTYAGSFTSQAYIDAFTNYMNTVLNLNLDYDDYLPWLQINTCPSPCGASGARIGIGSQNWFSGQETVSIDNLSQTARDLFGFLSNEVDSLITTDTLRPGTDPSYYKRTLYPYIDGGNDMKVKYSGTTSGAGHTLTMGFRRNDTLTPIFDTLTLSIPSGGAITFANLKQIIEFWGNPDTLYYGQMRGFYLSGVFKASGSPPDTILITGYTNNLNFFDRTPPPPSTSCYATSNSCLCSKPKYPVIQVDDDCISSMINQATINATNSYNSIVQAAYDNFIKNYKNQCFNATETFNRAYSLYEHNYTLYYYDRAGNLTRTVPPKGVHPLTSSGDLATAAASHASGPRIYPKHDFASNYIFLSNNGATHHESPDEDAGALYLYDFRGRIVISQNAKQAAAYDYSYTFYDEFGRITEVGVLDGTGSSPVLTPVIVRDPVWFASTISSGFNKMQVTATFYDQMLSTSASALFTGGQQNLRNRVSAVTFEETDDGVTTTYDYATHYSYDDHGNVAEMIQDHPGSISMGMQLRKISYEYDLVSGNVNKVYYDKNGPDQFIHQYNYDADNRLKEVYTSYDGVHWDKDAKYFYYTHGPLARTELGDKQVQGIDFAYTIHGWVKGINGEILNPMNDLGRDGKDNTSVALNKEYNSLQPNIHSDFASDVASYNLNYYRTSTLFDYQAASSPIAFKANDVSLQAGSSSFNLDQNSGNGPSLYNGNISSMVTSIYNLDASSPNYMNPIPQLAGFRYDQLHRIKQMTTFADLVKVSGVLQNTWATPSGTYDDYKMTMDYDDNGNISTLTRNGSTASGLSMDNLTYTDYEITGFGNTKTNRLIGVADVVSSTAYPADVDDMGTANPSDGTHASWNYDYDEIGSLIRDNQEHIASIEWTVDRKVRRINRDGTAKIVSGHSVYLSDLEFEYDGNRQRVQKIEKPRNSSGQLDISHWKYTYYVRDAKGNIAAIYKKHYDLVSGTNYTEVVEMDEQPVYGSSRVGMHTKLRTYTRPVSIVSGVVSVTGSISYPPTPWTATPTFTVDHTTGERQFEISNHLGNVLSVVTDKKIPSSVSSQVFSNDYDGDGIANQDPTHVHSGINAAGLITPLSTPPGVFPSSAFSTNVKAMVNPGDVVNASIWGYYTTVPSSGSPGMMVLTLTDESNNVLYVGSTQQWFSSDLLSLSTGSWHNLTYAYTVPTITGFSGQMYVNVYAWNPSSNMAWFDDPALNITYATPMVKNYSADHVSSQDYYAFGQEMPDRTFNSLNYRFGYNDKENVDEVYGATGTFEDYGMRMYDTRVCRFISVDPLTKSFPMLTPYQYTSNNPIMNIDLDGEEGIAATGINGQGMVVTPQTADNIRISSLVSLFKANFSEALPKKLIDQYAYGHGGALVLNFGEVVKVKSQPIGLRGIATSDMEKFDALIKGAKPGSEIKLPSGYSIQGQALTGGTLGRFTIFVEGKIIFDKKDATKWTFEGTMQFYDEWDFKTTPAGPKDLQGNEWRDIQTKIGDKFLPGEKFDVWSKKMPVKQNSGEDTFDWYKGKPTDGVQGRMSNFIYDHPTEGSHIKGELK